MRQLLGSGAGAWVMLLAIVACGLATAVFLHRRPHWALSLWLATVCLVPVWLGVSIGVYWEPAALIGLFVLAAAWFRLPPRFGSADWIFVCFLAACLLPVVVGGSSGPAIFELVSEWLVGFLLGRLVGTRLPLSVVHRTVAIAFTIVGALAVAEFVIHWNPFVDITAHNSLFEIWGTLQERGGKSRAEGAFGHSIALGCSLAMAIPLALACDLPLTARLAMTVMMLAGCVVTFSRTAMICAVIAVVLSVLFLRDPLPARLRAVIGGGFIVAAVLLIPVVTATFAAAGSEASDSAAYRGNLVSLVPDMAAVGMSPVAHVSPTGTLRFGAFGSIDSALILGGLTYGMCALAFALVLLLAGIGCAVRRAATPATLAVIAQMPALATVALITQYRIFFFFMAGLALLSQVQAASAGQDGNILRASVGRMRATGRSGAQAATRQRQEI